MCTAVRPLHPPSPSHTPGSPVHACSRTRLHSPAPCMYPSADHARTMQCHVPGWCAKEYALRHDIVSPLQYATTLYGGFYFVPAATFHSEVICAKRYAFGCNFWGGEGRNKNKLHANLYRLAFLCLPWQQNKVENPISSTV